MLLTIKLTSFAYNVYDGRCWSKITAVTGNKKRDAANRQRVKTAIKKVPGPLEYMGYVYCFAT
jgi:hypothetical protein